MTSNLFRRFPFLSIGVLYIAFVAHAQSIVVEQSVKLPIPNGARTDFGGTAVGGATDLTFTIRNNGQGPDLTGLGITVDGANATEFSPTTLPTPPVVNLRGLTTFTVRFAPTSFGNKTATLHIASNDSVNNPFNIVLVGKGIQAPLLVLDLPVGYSDPVDFGSVAGGNQSSLTFTIWNLGDVPLTSANIGIFGPNTGQFSVSTPPTVPVTPQGSTTFTIQFKPTGFGPESAGFGIGSNDPNSAQLVVGLMGFGTQAPFIEVEQPVGFPILKSLANPVGQSFGTIQDGERRTRRPTE